MSKKIEGVVASISQTGSLVCDIENGQLADIPHDDSVTIKFGPHTTVGIYPTDHDQPDATLVASLGVSGFLEIEIVGISVSEMLGIKAGTVVTVAWT